MNIAMLLTLKNTLLKGEHDYQKHKFEVGKKVRTRKDRNIHGYVIDIQLMGDGKYVYTLAGERISLKKNKFYEHELKEVK